MCYLFTLEDNKFSRNPQGPSPVKINAKLPESKLKNEPFMVYKLFENDFLIIVFNVLKSIAKIVNKILKQQNLVLTISGLILFLFCLTLATVQIWLVHDFFLNYVDFCNFNEIILIYTSSD